MKNTQTFSALAALAIALSSLAALPTPSAQAADAFQPFKTACGLENCDLNKEVQTFKGMTQAQRYRRLTDYRRAYKDSKDTTILKAMLALANRLEILFKEVGEEEWMVKEARTMASEARAQMGEGPASSTPTANTPPAQPAPAAEVPKPDTSCGLPVCNIDREIEIFRGLNQAARFQRMSDYRKNYKKATQINVLTTLVSLAKRLETLFKEVREEEWMIKETRGMAADALLQLAKNSEPKGALLASYYSQLSGEGPRFDVINFWRAKVKQYEESEPLLELLAFFSEAEKASIRDQDPEYLAKEAKRAQEEITSLLVQLYPYYEGVFEVTTHCEQGAGALCETGLIDRVVIMDTRSTDNLEISLVNSVSGSTVYAFKGVDLSQGGTTFEAVGTPAGVLSKLHLAYNRETHQLEGYIRNADTEGMLAIEGRQIGSPSDIFEYQRGHRNPKPLDPTTVSQTFQGKYGDYDVRLNIKTLAPNLLSGTLSFAAMPSQKIHFQIVNTLPKSGIAVLISSLPTGGRMKMTLFLQAEGSEIKVKGIAFSSVNGKVYSMDLASLPH